MSTNTKLAEARQPFVLANSSEEHITLVVRTADVARALAVLAAHEAKQALPLKDRPDFIAGYDAGLKDGRACERRDAAEQAAQAVPAGFKWVPVEPTLEMLTAAGREDDKAFVDGMPHGATADDVWAVMLSAAPAAPAPEAQQPAGQELPPLPPIDDYLPTDGPRWTTANFIACVERYATDYARAALAQRRQPLTDEDWRTRDSSDTDEGCAALHRAHGIGATTGEQQR